MGSLSTITFKTISVIAGEAHFIAQSTADVIKHTEGYLGHKLTGQSKSSIMSQRQALTKVQQSDYKRATKAIGQTFKNKFKPVTITVTPKTA